MAADLETNPYELKNMVKFSKKKDRLSVKQTRLENKKLKLKNYG